MNFVKTRRINSTVDGFDFEEHLKQAVWAKAKTHPDLPSHYWRIDTCGALIRWSDYGSTVSGGTGWEIDHIIPVSHGGTDNILNLQPLQWQNNRNKADRLDQAYCLIGLRQHT